MKPSPLLTLVFACFAWPGFATAQIRVTDQNFHAWFNYFGDHPLKSSRWQLHLESQFRRHEILRWQQLLFRPGINYEVSPWLTLSAGYAFIHSYRYGEFPAAHNSNEHRLWYHSLVRYRNRHANWSSRVRFENRFLEGFGENGRHEFRFENRIRGMQQVRIPLTEGTYLTAYNEVFIFVPPYRGSSAFDQNRAYIAYGRHLNRFWRLEAGYLNQALRHRLDGVLELNHTLVLSLYSHLPFGGFK